MFKKIFNRLLTLLFPVECLGCKKAETYFCGDCLKKISAKGRPAFGGKNEIKPCEHPLTYLNGIMSAADYHEPMVQSAIHYLKFRFIQELAGPLAKILADFWQNYNYNNVETHNYASLPTDNPIIVPVPLNKKRLLERGFNQAELIAKIFAGHFDYPLMTNAVIKHRHTRHQVGLSKKERLTNVKGAFKVENVEKISAKGGPALGWKNQVIILIDDVVTTGSTLEEIARVLKEAGAKEVWGLTVAKD